MYGGLTVFEDYNLYWGDMHCQFEKKLVRQISWDTLNQINLLLFLVMNGQKTAENGVTTMFSILVMDHLTSL